MLGVWCDNAELTILYLPATVDGQVASVIVISYVVCPEGKVFEYGTLVVRM